MSRYIDADKMIDGYSTTFPYDLSYCDDGDLMEWLDAQPTADVVEVRHGEWLDTGDEELDKIYSGYKCSVCGFIICGHSGKYCCECGAKMDGERREG